MPADSDSDDESILKHDQSSSRTIGKSKKPKASIPPPERTNRVATRSRALLSSSPPDVLPVPVEAPTSSNHQRAPPSPQVIREDVLQHRLLLRDGEVFYLEKFLDPQEAQEAYMSLRDLDNWYQPTLKVFGKQIVQSRSIVAYAAEPFELKYSGTKIKMQTEYPPVLVRLQKKVEDRLGVSFNHCLANNYKDGSVHIGKHRDDVNNKVIASLSLGAERDFILTHDWHTKDLDPNDGQLMKTRFALANGSLLVMQGKTQEYWKHEIPKQARVKEGRISLTFRQMLPPNELTIGQSGSRSQHE